MVEKTVSVPIKRKGTAAAEKGRLQPEKLTKWTKEPSVMDLKQDFDGAKTSHDQMIAKIKHWNNLRNIEGSARPPKIKGRSSLQPKLIRRQAEWRYSALSEPFNSSEDLFKAKPVTFEDELAAKQNQILLNWQFRTKLNRVNFIDEYVRTAVDEGTVIVRTGWKRITKMVEVEEPIFTYYEVQNEEEIAALEQAVMLKAQNPRGFQEISSELQAAVEYLEETGVSTVAMISGTQKVQQEKVVINQPTVDILNPENVFIDPSCQGDIEKAGFIVYTFETSQAELKKDGRYKNLKSVNWSGAEILAQPDHATKTPGDFNYQDELRKRIVAHEYWGYRDVDGTGELKAIVATWIGNTMIRMEESPFPDEKPPFTLVHYLPVRRTIMGEPDAEILEDNQRVIGALTRGMIDLMGRSANAQQGTAKGFLDAVNRRRYEAGLDYEFNPSNGDPRLSIFQHQYPEIPNSALQMIQLQNFEAESISGVKAFSGGLSGEAYGDVAAGIKGMLDAAAKREMNILRRLADGIKRIGTKIAAMNAVFLSEEEVVRVTNREFVVIRREDLAGNFDISVEISTPEVDQAQADNLSFMLQTMGPDMAPEMSQLILAEIAELKKMPALAEKIRTWQPRVDPVAEEIKKLELEKLRMEVEKLRTESIKNQALAEKASAEADVATLDFVEQETGTKHAREMERISEQARANQDLEVTKALLKPKKVEETKPDVPAAIGFNRISDALFSRV